jgi:uncharacterized metal-binding protein YceD (DUF177 family)
MKNLVEYLIPFKGLSIGKHDYEFHVQDTFFKALESKVVEKGDLKVNILLDKESRLISVDLDIKGNLSLVCDRCLEYFDFPIDINYTQIYKFGNPPDNQNDDIIYLSEKEYQIDVSRLIYENILLQIPIKKVHPDDENGESTCNPDQLELLENLRKQPKADPRWDALKNIKFED